MDLWSLDPHSDSGAFAPRQLLDALFREQGQQRKAVIQFRPHQRVLVVEPSHNARQAVTRAAVRVVTRRKRRPRRGCRRRPRRHRQAIREPRPVRRDRCQPVGEVEYGLGLIGPDGEKAPGPRMTRATENFVEQALLRAAVGSGQQAVSPLGGWLNHLVIAPTRSQTPVHNRSSPRTRVPGSMTSGTAAPQMAAEGSANLTRRFRPVLRPSRPEPESEPASYRPHRAPACQARR